MKKLLLLIVIVFVSGILVLKGAVNVNADSSNYPLYYSSENSFEYSNNNSYIYDSQESETNTFGILKYAWTATGEIVNLLDPVTDKKDGQTIFSFISSINSSSVKGAAKQQGALFGAKVIGAISEVFAAVGHPWFFLMTLSFGTILLSGWFLRFSTGVSPPVERFAIWSNNLNH